MDTEIFNPLDKRNLDISIADAIFKKEVYPLKDLPRRFLVVDDIWISLGESLLIEKTKPLWNVVVDGFGNHDPGGGRYNRQISSWDTLYPGRSWAKKLQKGKTVEEISEQIFQFLQ
ncbi:MAG: Eco29kI family restriction endonuclease [Treponema sp.]|jgi:hypothetical protein|nr:Eco29kI family restriction endonuclease [Treponema sp.]